MSAELDHLYQGFSYLSWVIEHQNRDETTPKLPIFKALENCLLPEKTYWSYSVLKIIILFQDQ